MPLACGRGTCTVVIDVSTLVLSNLHCRRFPQSPFGSGSDVPYELVRDFDACDSGDEECKRLDRLGWVTSVHGLTLLAGDDPPQSQSIALMSAIDEWDWSDDYYKVQWSVGNTSSVLDLMKQNGIAPRRKETAS